MHRLALHYLANPEPEAQFALLSDWADADTARTGGDADSALEEHLRRFGIPLPGGPRRAPRGNGDDEPQQRGVGSGFIISADGYIMTNAHVVGKADDITVSTPDKREFKAKLVGADTRTDVALLKIEGANLPAVTVGNPALLKAGEWVVAIGAPFGFDNSVTAGIVSAKGRQLPGDAYVPFIQTDVAVNPGNSGGPLFNLDGQVVGINSQIYSRSGGFMGISFAIPIDVAMNVAKQLQQTGKVSRGRIGVQIQPLTQELAQSFGLKSTDGALVSAATLSNRYISDRFLPDKAIDLIDEAGARMRIRRMTAPPDLREFDERIADARKEKESAIDAQDFEKAASLRDKEKTLVAERAEREKQWRSGDMDVVAEVDDEQIAEVLGNWTGIPVFKLTEEETTRLLRMEDELHRRIIGQEDAVKAVSKAIRRTRAGLKDPKRPSGSFIFAGPSGVGKTELSKALANFLFGDDDALIQIDMGEFHDRFTASRLFGAPPGYVGYEEGGQLTEKVRRKPFSVVLFDEIEKAHSEIYNTLLQVLEDGRLTDGQGRTVDFKNTVLIFTSNLGTSDISKAVGLGFTKSDDSKSNYERMKLKVNDELKKHFRPEFLNRIDDVIVFHQLTQDEIIQMVDLMIGRVETQMKNKDMALELTDKAKSLLAKRGFDPVLGARPLRRTIQREIEDQLSEKILFGELTAGQIVLVDVENWDGEGDGENAKFTFAGSDKPRALPDAPVELTKAADEAS